MSSTKASRSGPLSCARSFSIIESAQVELLGTGRPTNHIVAILVLHHELQRTCAIAMQGRQLCNNGLSLSVGAALDALLHHVGGKFMFGQRQQLRSDDLDNLGTVFRLPVLNDVLCDVVAVLVGDEHRSALVQFLKDAGLITRFAILQYPLNDSASIGMCSKHMHLAFERFDDELDVLRWYSLDGLLHHVVAILILDTFEDVGLEFGHERGLLVRQDVLESLETLVARKTRREHSDRPFEQPCIRTFASTIPPRDSSSALPVPASGSDCHARTAFG